MRVFSGVGYAVLPKEMQGKRNVVCQNAKANLLVDRRGKFVRGDVDGDAGKFAGGTGGRRESGPRFRSEKSRAGKEAEAEDVSCRGLLNWMCRDYLTDSTRFAARCAIDT